MAANTHLSLAAWNAALDAALGALDGGFLEIYDGAQPATPDVAVTTQVKLVKMTLAGVAFAAAAGGVKTANAIAVTTCLASGTASWMRAFKTGGAIAVIDGSVGVAGSGCDLIIPSTALVLGAPFGVILWTITYSVGQ